MKASGLLPAVMALVAFAGTAMADAASAATSWTDPYWVSTTTFEFLILATTNGYRSRHGASALTWSDTLAHYAANYLNVNNCKFEHSDGPYGENLAFGFSSPATSVQAWGGEESDYDYNNPGFSHATGHFTQLVWKSTTQVGCSRRWCGDSMGWYLVCEYDPPGNYIGEFAQNVGRPTG